MDLKKSDHIKKIIDVTLILTVLLLILFPAVPATGKQYKIATVAWMGWSPLHVASEKGLWKELGLDVKVITYDDPIVILEAIKAKKIDFAMDMVGSLVGVYMKGEPVIALAETNWSHGGDKIVVRKGDTIRNNIDGTIGVFLDQPSCLFFLEQYLRVVNLKLSDFRIVEINSRDLSAQFIAHRLPAIVNYEPWVSQAVTKGNGVVLATSADYEGCIPECLWAYRQTVENTPSKDIHNLLKGWINAVLWLKKPENRNEFFGILKKRTFKDEKEVTGDHLAKMLEEVRIHGLPDLRERNKNMGGLFDYLTSLKSFLKQENRLKKTFTPEAIFKNQYVMHVLKKNYE